MYVTILCTCPTFQNGFSDNKTYFVALFNDDLQMVLLGQITSTNSYLLMHTIFVGTDRLKYNFGKQKSVWLVKMFG